MKPKPRIRMLSKERLAEKQAERSKQEAIRDHYLYKQEMIMQRIHYSTFAPIN